MGDPTGYLDEGKGLPWITMDCLLAQHAEFLYKVLVSMLREETNKLKLLRKAGQEPM